MRIHGQELSADVVVDDAALRSESVLVGSLRAGAEALGCPVLSEHVQRFEPDAFTAVAIIGESHLLVSTYPELGIASFNIQTCSARLRLLPALEAICSTLGARLVRSLVLLRHLDLPFQVELQREAVPVRAGRLCLDEASPTLDTRTSHDAPAPAVESPLQ